MAGLVATVRAHAFRVVALRRSKLHPWFVRGGIIEQGMHRRGCERGANALALGTRPST